MKLQNTKNSEKILKAARDFFFKDFIYLFMRNTHREAETQAEGQAGSLQGTPCGTQSQGPGITP